MKKQSHLIIYSIVLITLITSPFWLWEIQPSKKLNVLIMGQIDSNESDREHKGLTWILNNQKYLINKHQFYPVESVDQIEKAVQQSKGRTIIAENILARLKTDKERDKISNVLNVDWTGWIGRYFSDLNGNEVPVWVKKQYEANHQRWKFNGQGIVLINRNHYIVVVDQKDLTDHGLLFTLTKHGESFLKDRFQGKYQNWFDINQARDPGEILASYHFPVSAKVKKRLESYGIPANFPAVIYHQTATYTSYYFSGDFADESELPEIYQTKGLDFWKRHFGTGDSFYWEGYVPMMKALLKNGLNHTVKQEKVETIDDNGITTNSRTGSTYIQIQKNGKWTDFLIKGVNIGISKPGYFPGETAITKEEYLRWFQEIGAMNANAIRVYTIHPPPFYEAFYEYNQMAKKPLYLFHGSWVNEENLIRTQDAYAKVNVNDAESEIKNIIDIIHGKANLPPNPGHAYGLYPYDISKYVLGMIVGIEWDPQMVKNTDVLHADKEQFKGQYFQTSNASAFEVWLAKLMEYAVGYEKKEYKWQHSMSFTNWVTTDLLRHPSEPLKDEDLVSVNPNHIKASSHFHAGLFASYHIYPYYPDFLNYDPAYVNYKDFSGKKNNYAGYLHDLIAAHHMPVLVAEYGVPASRGLTHKNVFGMNQGFHSEAEQGEIDKRLFQSIVSEGYAGGLVFTWQDEWFKRTWNTMDFDNPDRRPYWDNQQTNEQHFGLLSFEPGKQETAISVDGESKDWDKAGIKRIYRAKNTKEPVKELRMASDSGYFYYLLTLDQPVNFKDQGIFLLFDTFDNQGQTRIKLTEKSNVQTNYGIDFLVKLTGQEDSRLLGDSYYDPFYLQYGNLLHMIELEPNVNQKNNGIFHPMRLALNKQLYIPSTKKTIPFQDYETGVLKFGDANSSHLKFNSLTDVSISKNKKEIEGRIPWQLLNIKDPSTKEAMGDVWKNGLFSSVKINGIRAAIVTTRGDTIQQALPNLVNNRIQQHDAFLYSWKNWDQPEYYERLKQSYDIMKKTYQTIDTNDLKK